MTAPLAPPPPPHPDRPSVGETANDAVGSNGELSGATPNVPPEQSEAGASGASRLSRKPFNEVVREWAVRQPWPAWFSSAILHAMVLIVLSFVLLTAPTEKLILLTDAFDAGDLDTPTIDSMNVNELAPTDIPAPAGEPSLGPIGEGQQVSLPGERADTVGNVETGEANAGAFVGPGPSLTVDDFGQGSELAPGGLEGDFTALTNPLASRGGGLEGRRFENRRSLALSGGGTDASEKAVEAGLAWLAEHQCKDGGWVFTLEDCPNCAGYCRNPGIHRSPNAATGLALLCFLGAGYTHLEGPYQEEVAAGLYFLQEHMLVSSRGGDFRESFEYLRGNDPTDKVIAPKPDKYRRMYTHGIATLALTEAYAMSRDERLLTPAKEAVKFIVNAQYADGGWRYEPGWEVQPPGDITVTGWQLMALKSAALAGIDVPYETWTKATEFLDGLEQDRGGAYEYVRGERHITPATTSVGVLCRMITGWPKEHRPLLRGVARVASFNPTQENIYYTYYAAQSLHHAGGSQWDRWNPRMRDYLVDSQATEGHEIGSWYFPEAYSSFGGRLYTTTMAVMSLEVYYRYMPIYQEAFVK